MPETLSIDIASDTRATNSVKYGGEGALTLDVEAATERGTCASRDRPRGPAHPHAVGAR